MEREVDRPVCPGDLLKIEVNDAGQGGAAVAPGPVARAEVTLASK